MATVTQLDPTLPVEVEGKGKGRAFLVIDYGEDHNLHFVVGLDASGEIWCVPNYKLRLQSNWTFGRAKPVWPE